MTGNSTYNAEVVVIGGGLAGMVTALELLDNGKRVLMLDAATREQMTSGVQFALDSAYPDPEAAMSGVFG